MSSEDEAVWRLPNKSRGSDVRLGGGRGATFSPSLSPGGKARLQRIVKRVPEVMVKITGRSRGTIHLKQHLDYITRNGQLLAETQDGMKVETRADLRALHDDWLAANALTERSKPNPTAAQSVGIILSMPAGTPPDKLHEAARTWARESLPDNDWLLVRHEDKDHPHVHLSVRAVGYDGKRLVTGPADLQRWRETFARELRRFGVEAEATPRQARGAVRRNDGPALHRLSGREPSSIVAKRREAEATREAIGAKPSKISTRDSTIQHRQQSIRTAYLAHADTLDGGSKEDQRLARDVRAFVAGMPVPLNRRQIMSTALQSVRNLETGREEPASSPTVSRSETSQGGREQPQIEQQEPASPRLRR